jgi:hypothetical protein
VKVVLPVPFGPAMTMICMLMPAVPSRLAELTELPRIPLQRQRGQFTLGSAGVLGTFQHAVGVPLSRSKQVQWAQRSRFSSF